ncbi:MAG: sigma-54-dependent transcriptional regulator [Myxococcota bacterium]
MAHILVVDDNETMREGMAISLRKVGHDVTTAPGGEAAIAAFKKNAADLVVTDLKMEPVDGMAVLTAVREVEPDVMVMVVTGHGSVPVAVQAMKLGAFDFLEKPVELEVLRAKVDKGLEIAATRARAARLEEENAYLRETSGKLSGLDAMVGESPKMKDVLAAIDKVARTDASTLVQGESGTGKELVARAIHSLSPRRDGPFITVNCGALAETLLESELFGHEKGAFTGAIKRKSGRFELADGGTLFLDEIGDLSHGLQVKLLRVLQERSFERVGGERTISVDVRVVSATHKDLKAEVEAGRFREDLFYRLHVVPVHLPPLRERGRDVLLLAGHFVERIGRRMGRKVDGFTEAAQKLLLRYRWPGNVRELENAVEQAMVFAEGEVIDAPDLPTYLQDGPPADPLCLPPGEVALPEVLEDLERQLILRAYEQAGGVKTETARLLGIKTSALYYKLDKYGIGDRGAGSSGAA